MKYLIFLFGFIFLLSSCEDRLLEREEYSINIPGSWLDDMAVDAYGSLWLATGEIDTTIEIPDYSSYLPSRHYLIQSLPGSYDVLDNDFIEAKEILFDRNNRLWIMADKNLYYYHDVGKYINVRSLDDSTGHFDWMINDHDNNIWVGGYSTDLLMISPDLKVTQHDSLNSQIPSGAVYTAHADSKNNLWMSFGSYGIGKRDPGGNWTFYNTSNSPVTSQIVHSITSDKFGNIWFGTDYSSESGNLMRFDGRDWINLYAKDENGFVVRASVRQMYSGRTKIWIVANEIKPYEPGKVFLLTYDGSVWKRVSEVPEDDMIVDIQFDYYNNKAWVGTANNGCLHIK